MTDINGPEDRENAAEQTEEDLQYIKRQAKRKRKRMLWMAVQLCIAAVICVPLIFFCFWAGTKLFFPAVTEVTGIDGRIAGKASADFTKTVSVTNPAERELKLQRFDEETGSWITEETYDAGSGEESEVDIVFPKIWTKYTYSRWRLRMDRAFGVKRYSGKPFDVVCRNRGGVKVKCASAVVYCKDDQEVIYDKKMNRKLPNASTTKMITAILALENTGDDDIVKVSRRVMITPYSSFGFHAGARFRMYDLMRAMLITSSNESANAVAEHIAGSYEDFADMMNARAKELGCRNSNFITPSGLDLKGHYSTAYDLALINAKAVDFDEYNKIMLMKEYKFTDIDKTTGKNEDGTDKEYTAKTTNDLLEEKIKGYMGGKTGTTPQAGNCLSSAYKWNGKTYIIVVLDAGDRFKTTKTLMKYVRKYA